MDTHQLEVALKRDECLSATPHFGVLASDELGLVRKPGAYIVNTDPSHLPGKHWITLYLSRNEPPEVFDSLARHPDEYHFLKRFFRGRSFTYNTERWQKAGTATCGQFCLFYLYHRCRGWTLLQIEHFYWNADLQKNEDMVTQFARHYLYITVPYFSQKRTQRACKCLH